MVVVVDFIVDSVLDFVVDVVLESVVDVVLDFDLVWVSFLLVSVVFEALAALEPPACASWGVTDNAITIHDNPVIVFQ